MMAVRKGNSIDQARDSDKQQSNVVDWQRSVVQQARNALKPKSSAVSCSSCPVKQIFLRCLLFLFDKSLARSLLFSVKFSYPSQGGVLMAYRRKSSEIIADAQERAGNLRAIDPNLDLGNSLTPDAYDAKITEAQTSLDAYNGLLAQADAAGNDFRAVEKQLRDLSSQMLSGVKVKYGRDSNEYEMAGGTRLSDINHHPHGSGKKHGEDGESVRFCWIVLPDIVRKLKLSWKST
jgi:hypothetical protein